jgi:hypothetical protein
MCVRPVEDIPSHEENGRAGVPMWGGINFAGIFKLCAICTESRGAS